MHFNSIIEFINLLNSYKAACVQCKIISQAELSEIKIVPLINYGDYLFSYQSAEYSANFFGQPFFGK
jgi:hypothetical protein